MAIPMPAWFEALPPEEQEKERKKFLLKIAALYASREGTVRELSNRLGYSSNTLGQFSSSGKPLGALLCIEIEKACGPSYLPRTILNPHLFVMPIASQE